MKKIFLIKILISTMIILLIILSVSVNSLSAGERETSSQSQATTTNVSSTNHVMESSKGNLISNDPIIIRNDDDFYSYGFSGTGIADNPFLIQNYDIITDQQTGIKIDGTTKYFIIQNNNIHAKEIGIMCIYNADRTVKITQNTLSNNEVVGIKVSYSAFSEISEITISNGSFVSFISNFK